MEQNLLQAICDVDKIVLGYDIQKSLNE